VTRTRSSAAVAKPNRSTSPAATIVSCTSCSQSSAVAAQPVRCWRWTVALPVPLAALTWIV
jgi:hypothetical protein